MKSGAQGDTEQLALMLADVFGGSASFTNIPAYNLVSAALTEAMLNAVQHAYEDPEDLAYPSSDSHRWWVAGYRDPRSKEVALMFYDQGVTIPASLPKNWREAARSVLARAGNVVSISDNSTDGEMIAAGMEVGRSSTKKRNRGWGLSEMRTLVGGPPPSRMPTTAVPKLGAGSMRILSRRGDYLYSSESGEAYRTLPDPFTGTLIIWKLAGSDIVAWDMPDGTTDA